MKEQIYTVKPKKFHSLTGLHLLALWLWHKIARLCDNHVQWHTIHFHPLI